MGKFRLKRKIYSKYDETDNLKRMNDADILAEKKKEKPGYGNVLSKVGTGAVVGALAGAALGGFKKGGSMNSMKKGLKTGALLGGAALGIGAINKRNREKDDVDFYNRRLSYAQRQAKRREAKDWKANMTQREGYSY